MIVLAEDSADVSSPSASSLAQQRNLWLSQAATPPKLQCGKDAMFDRTLELLQKIAEGEATDLNASPTLSDGSNSRTWRQHYSALRGMGTVENRRGILHLTQDGEELLAAKSRTHLASLIARRTRLFAESLGLLVASSLTVEEVNTELVDSYRLDWTSLTGTRNLLTWLEILGLIEWLGDRKLGATSTGRDIYTTWDKVLPAAIVERGAEATTDIPAPPVEIEAVLEKFSADESAQDERNTYNIWVPSPAADPSKIENMRTSVAAAAEPIEKEALLSFIAQRFGLRRSSVDSMLPFMRAGGFLQEVRRGVFVATPAAKAWLRSGSDIDFIRILHGHMRFVGELLRVAHGNIPRHEVYRKGALYGMNKEKIRWIIAFLTEAGLLFATSWSSVEATTTGRRLAESLPLAAPPSEPDAPRPSTVTETSGAGQLSELTSELDTTQRIAEQLLRTANDPSADGKSGGAAFESSIEQAFKHLGFLAQRISGPGDTDVLVQWYDDNGSLRTAIVDGKSTSSGQITHTNVSDIAITTHKDKNSADFVAIIAPAFAGNTIRDMAAKKEWALVTAAELGEVVTSAYPLGLRPAEVGVLFEMQDGLSRVAGLIESRQRQLDIVSLVVARLKEEAENEGSLSPRDISLIERRSELAPTIDELTSMLDLLVSLDTDIVRVVSKSEEPQHVTYQNGEARSAVNRLRAWASAIERSL